MSILQELPSAKKHGWPRTEEVNKLIYEGDDWPKITIVTPSYNQGNYLEETIRSVLLQNYPNLEYIIIDGGSTDNTKNIIKKYENWITYWISEPDYGQSNAINKGMRQSTGQILNWINSDDIFLPKAFYYVARYLKSHPKVGMVYGDRYIIDLNSNIIDKVKYHFFLKRQLYYKSGVAQETAFWRKDLFFKAGQVDEALKFVMDYELWWRFSKISVIRHLPVYLGAFRDHLDSKSNKIREKRNIEYRLVIRKHLKRDVYQFEKIIFNYTTSFLKLLARLVMLDKVKRAFYFR